MMTTRRGSVAIAGIAESDIGSVAEGMSPVDLMAQATARALDDCGLAFTEIDGVFATCAQQRMATLALCEYLGLQPRYADSNYLGGSSFMSHVAHAQAAIEAGLCSVALIAYGSTQRQVGRKTATKRDESPYEDHYRPFLPASGYALAAARHMHEFGTTREQLASVAVAARQWATMNPRAWSRGPLTIEDVISAPIVSSPLTVRDCCLVTDGGGAVILVSAERSRSLKKKPAYVLGVGEATSHVTIANMRDLTTTAAKLSGAQTFAMAGLAPRDVDVIELYDAFTINTILFLEDLGFCPKGEGGRFAADGSIAPGGAHPTNTNGGGLSYCHPGMYGIFLLVEAVRQLRGECGPRQVDGCNVAIAHGNGGVMASQATVLLGSEATL